MRGKFGASHGPCIFVGMKQTFNTEDKMTAKKSKTHGVKAGDRVVFDNGTGTVDSVIGEGRSVRCSLRAQRDQELHASFTELVHAVIPTPQFKYAGVLGTSTVWTVAQEF